MLLLFLTACNSSSENKRYTYSKEKLIAVISDMYIASEALKKIDPALKDSMNEIFKDQISKIHQVDFNLVETDLERLTNDPEYYTVLHKSIRDTLVAQEATINAMKYD